MLLCVQGCKGALETSKKRSSRHTPFGNHHNRVRGPERGCHKEGELSAAQSCPARGGQHHRAPLPLPDKRPGVDSTGELYLHPSPRQCLTSQYISVNAILEALRTSLVSAVPSARGRPHNQPQPLRRWAGSCRAAWSRFCKCTCARQAGSGQPGGSRGRPINQRSAESDAAEAAAEGSAQAEEDGGYAARGRRCCWSACWTQPHWQSEFIRICNKNDQIPVRLCH